MAADSSSLSDSGSSESEMILECESESEEEEVIGVQPYIFEPEGSISLSNSDLNSDIEIEQRTLNDDWSTTGHRKRMCLSQRNHYSGRYK